MPGASPAPDFRRKLHEALERTHRQHAAQRVLGTRRAAIAPPPRRWPWLVVLAGLVVLAVVMLRRQIHTRA